MACSAHGVLYKTTLKCGIRTLTNLHIEDIHMTLLEHLKDAFILQISMKQFLERQLNRQFYGMSLAEETLLIEKMLKFGSLVLP